MKAGKLTFIVLAEPAWVIGVFSVP